MKASVRRLSNLIMSLFPEADTREPRPNLDYLSMDMSWRSNDDPKRPNKRTKTFRIIISQEHIEDFEMLSEREKIHFEQKITNFIMNKRSQMQPNHTNAYGSVPPIEEWFVIV